MGWFREFPFLGLPQKNDGRLQTGSQKTYDRCVAILSKITNRLDTPSEHPEVILYLMRYNRHVDVKSNPQTKRPTYDPLLVRHEDIHQSVYQPEPVMDRELDNLQVKLVKYTSKLNCPPFVVLKYDNAWNPAFAKLQSYLDLRKEQASIPKQSEESLRKEQDLEIEEIIWFFTVHDDARGNEQEIRGLGFKAAIYGSSQESEKHYVKRQLLKRFFTDKLVSPSSELAVSLMTEACLYKALWMVEFLDSIGVALTLRMEKLLLRYQS